MLVTDRSLARRLERTEGAMNAAIVRARATLAPESGATWRDFDGTYAMFDGIESPITQTFGLGLFRPPTDAGLDEIESFYTALGAPTHHETCPLADMTLLGLLPGRGYRPVEQSSVLYRGIDAASLPSSNGTLRARRIEDGEQELWTETAALGWSEYPELGDFMRDFGRITAVAQGMHPFIVEHDGEAIAAAALAMHKGVALLAGASTRREHRGLGAQAALFVARLRYAHEHGCDLAMMAAQPGSSSQRNAERKGFRIGYTRTKWMRTPSS